MLRPLIIGFIVVACGASGNDQSLPLTLEVVDERVLTVLPSDMKAQVIANDIGWAEGPLWVPELDSLLFSDIKLNTVLKWSEATGLETYLSPSGHNPDGKQTPWRGSNGLAINSNGELILAQQGGRTVAKMLAPLTQPVPQYQLLATSYHDKRLNSPNDLVFHNNGTLFFTDPPYGLDGFESSSLVELPFFGVFALSPDNAVRLIDSSLSKPNGIALTQDNRFLFVSDSQPDVHRIWRYTLDTDGGVIAKALFFDAMRHTDGKNGGTDGLKEHQSGLLFITLPGGIAVLSQDGKLLAKLNIGVTCNLAFDSDYRYLYVTQPHRVMRIPLIHTMTNN